MFKKNQIISLISGLFMGIFLLGIFLEPNTTKTIMDIIQSFTLSIVAIFTAWWTSKTFSHDLRSQEAKEIIDILNQMRGCIPNIVHPVTPLPNTDLSNIEKLAREWEKEREATSLRSWYRLKALQESLHQVVNKSVTIEVLTKIKLLRIGHETNYISVKNDMNKGLFKDIITMQTVVAREAYFNVGLEWLKFKKFFGF